MQDIFSSPTTAFAFEWFLRAVPPTVHLDFGSLKNVSINVINLSGQSVYSNINIPTSRYQFELIEAAGIYFVEVISERGKQHFKLVLNH